ncbi:hypothetical protein NE865_09884 [Phthorimaea operculella]|nr:hypothetical protein NE865_09884 [Phthorimaea operculella]
MDKSRNISQKELRAYCENAAKTMNLNIVRLRFSAHDINTDKEICPPVFSEPINNMKSAATNDLKICRMSRHCGRPRGGDDVFILVEKVNKKNIVIRFYEVNEEGDEVWSANGNFLQSDVHHQYAIVFRTPPYRDPQITRDVTVYMELMRPSDGRTSERKEFVYKAEQVFKHNKRRRVNSNYSSTDSSSGELVAGGLHGADASLRRTHQRTQGVRIQGGASVQTQQAQEGQLQLFFHRQLLSWIHYQRCSNHRRNDRPI